MRNKMFKSLLFIIIATIAYYFIIISFTPMKMSAPAPDITAKHDIEPQGRIVITVDDVEKETFDFLNWLIASGLGMITYAAKKGIDFGFILLEKHSTTNVK